ncbi:RagB/SusD family nutrient uptake outer membrane protein [Chitinophaga oryziterrae]|uniref:RagB/SusD family nutrient uptake outer membrane protein n=1 Tax=Chitinophaga oryziterrae TaxID=1031224 RepID=A0A6N8J2P9_9BACT|nr:RagB/SusD family nutrient uptake outer membrane protein [Chitinophaga oryziterrae]MVT39031.1 RagB/SusD family nutrient uptake outer membrane protein [Chitinophaga oryziterrae]
MQRYILVMVALSVLILTGCSKNLDQQPKSTAGNAAVFGSEDGLKLYSNSFYDGLPGISDVYKTDAMADYSAVNSVPDFLRAGAYNSRVSDGWTWSTLRNINYFIANCNNPAISATVRNNYIGLARFFRAWFYYDKVKRFGDVPWIGKPITIDDNATLYAGRDSRTVVMDSVIADLNFAIDNITLKTDATGSQITKYVACGFKSRVCLFEGTFRKYQGVAGGADTLLQLAADAAKRVMDEGGFSLNQATGTSLSYRQLFTSAAPVTSEIMLANVASSTLAVYNDANWYFTSATYGSRLSFTKTFINTYLDIDGTPFTSKAGYDTLPFVKETQGRDKRLQQTIRMGSYTRTDNGKVIAAPPVFSYTYTGYMPIKWSVDDTYFDNGTTNVTSVSLMRYAEILLNYAEAMEELGKLSDADWTKTIGALRARAGITGGTTAKPAVADSYLQTNYFPGITDAALLEIRRERGIELALEGFRFADLIRWKRGDLLAGSWHGMYVPALNVPMDLNGDGVYDVCFYQTLPANQVTGVTYINVSSTLNGVTNPLQLSNGTSGEIHWLDNVAKEWADYKYLYPIPYTDLQLNPKLGQNPIWQ